MSTLYTASATATGDGRNGHVRSSDGVLDFDLAVPKELGGAGGALTNPEQLFAAGYAACFHSALKRAASSQKLTLTDTAITVDVGIGPLPSGGFGLSVTIEAELPGLDETTAKAVLDAAHQLCPYSNATRGNVEVQLNLA
ncbi:organic hydroperoxide resistance protein [Actinoplanes xinjiangensis]|jgi:osmotically inducible protein OsmC|uniref:Ohr subfamily peroxiredoxin n=1 Tax=Actinoplanes xinjiangensis TaxID=512350 RepID=A0A316EAV7_9ACTN|nr:organic hydroperoxide resistance protein [Actinoplanes xinjiangensis]PWK27262.1 Ohr subfamily peroxiredoxin [Actinoplanes xinjiangensis]GIF45317.1 organic hydroperoxide resistance protein [Actinoplanes xinjiangensis]